MSEKVKGRDYYFTKRIFVEEIQKRNGYWMYVVVETPYPTITHRTTYHSTNLLALERHRTELLIQLEKEREFEFEASYAKGIEVKPTLIEQLKTKIKEKTR